MKTFYFCKRLSTYSAYRSWRFNFLPSPLAAPTDDVDDIRKCMCVRAVYISAQEWLQMVYRLRRFIWLCSPFAALTTCVDHMGWLRWVSSLQLYVSFAECSLFHRALLRKRPIILRSLLIVALIVATPYTQMYVRESHVYFCPRVTTDGVQIKGLYLVALHFRRADYLCASYTEMWVGQSHVYFCRRVSDNATTGEKWRLTKWYVSLAKEPYQRDYILHLYRLRRFSSWRSSFAAPTSCVYRTRKCVWVRAIYVCNNKVSAYGICINVFQCVAFPFRCANYVCISYTQMCVNESHKLL